MESSISDSKIVRCQVGTSDVYALQFFLVFALRRDWLDMKLLLVSSTSKRPEMLLSLYADKPEYKRVTLDTRQQPAKPGYQAQNQWLLRVRGSSSQMLNPAIWFHRRLHSLHASMIINGKLSRGQYAGRIKEMLWWA